MNAHINLIHEYIDGSLAPYLEELLFAELSTNESLRRELSSQVALQRVAQRDAQAIQAPSSSRDAVFQQLGLQQAATHSPAMVESAQTLASSTSLAARYGKSLQGTMLCAAFLLGLFSYHVGLHSFGSNASTLQSSSQTNSGSALANTQSLASFNSGNVEKGNTNSNLSAKNSELVMHRENANIRGVDQHHKRSAHSLASGTTITNSNRTDASQQATVGIHPIDSQNILSSQTTIQSDAMATALAMVEEPPVAIAPFYLDSPYQLELSAFAGNARPNGSAYNLDNLAIALLVELDEHTTIGVECANSLYAIQHNQRVAGTEVTQNLIENRPTIAALVREQLLSIKGPELSSYAEAALGASAMGDVLGRASIGLQWHPDGILSLHCACNYQMLNYRTSSSRQNSGALSLMYGVAVHF